MKGLKHHGVHFDVWVDDAEQVFKLRGRETVTSYGTRRSSRIPGNSSDNKENTASENKVCVWLYIVSTPYQDHVAHTLCSFYISFRLLLRFLRSLSPLPSSPAIYFLQSICAYRYKSYHTIRKRPRQVFCPTLCTSKCIGFLFSNSPVTLHSRAYKMELSKYSIFLLFQWQL